MWWLANWRHVARYGHTPEWIHLGGMMACFKCTKGGRRERIPRVRRLDPLRAPL